MTVFQALTDLNVIEVDGRPLHAYRIDKAIYSSLAGMVVESSKNRKFATLGTKPECAYARFLCFRFEDGSEVSLYLDQGFGAWRKAPRRKARFDHDAAPDAQPPRFGTWFSTWLCGTGIGSLSPGGFAGRVRFRTGVL